MFLCYKIYSLILTLQKTAFDFVGSKPAQKFYFSLISYQLGYKEKKALMIRQPKFRSNPQVNKNSSKCWHGIILHTKKGNLVLVLSNRDSHFKILEAEKFLRRCRHLRLTEMALLCEIPCLVSSFHNLLHFRIPIKVIQIYGHELWERRFLRQVQGCIKSLSQS